MYFLAKPMASITYLDHQYSTILNLSTEIPHSSSLYLTPYDAIILKKTMGIPQLLTFAVKTMILVALPMF